MKPMGRARWNHEQEPYPTDDDLARIRTWRPEDGWPALMDYIHHLWWRAEWGWTQDGPDYHMSTGGEAGNQAIISTLKENDQFWLACFQAYLGSGHWEFRVPQRMWSDQECH